MAINSQETTDDEDFTEGSAYDPYYGDFEITNDNRLNSETAKVSPGTFWDRTFGLDFWTFLKNLQDLRLDFWTF